MREREVERILGERVHRLGGLYFKIAPTHVGLPDRMILLPGGRIILVEVKAENGHLDPAQRLLHKRMLDVGTEVVVIWGPEQARNFLSE
jgi:hypothetical protein